MRWPWTKSEPRARQLQALRDGVSKTPADLPSVHVLPVLVPASFFALGNWPGPYDLLQIEGLGRTWAVLQPERTMVYVNADTAAYWEAGGLDWRALAMSNLR